MVALSCAFILDLSKYDHNDIHVYTEIRIDGVFATERDKEREIAGPLVALRAVQIKVEC